MKAYTDPTIKTLGKVAELTAIVKCGGSADAFNPDQLQEKYAEEGHCND